MRPIIAGYNSGRGWSKIMWSGQQPISALPGFNQSLRDFFNLSDSRLILTLMYGSLNLVINAFSLRFWGHGSGERKSIALQQLDCRAYCTHNAPVRCLLGFLFRKVMLKHQIGLFIQLIKYSYNDTTMLNKQGQQGSNQHLQLPILTHAHTQTYKNNIHKVNT